MDNSPVPVMAKRDNNLLAADKLNSKEVVQSLEPSPTRSSVKSIKTATSPNTNRFGGKKVSPKVDSKSNISLTRSVNSKDLSTPQTRKTTSPTTNKSPNSSTSSKIPSIKRPSFIGPKAAVEQKTQEPKPTAQKTLPQKIHPVKKELDLKQKQISRVNPKSGISTSKAKQDKILSRANSQSGISTSEPMQDQIILRSNSKTGISGSEPMQNKILSRTNSQSGINTSEPKQDKMIARSNSKTSISGSEPMQDKKLCRANSQSGISTSEPKQDKTVARSNSKTSISGSEPMQDKKLCRPNSQSGISTSEPKQDKIISRSNSKTSISGSEPMQDKKLCRAHSQSGISTSEPKQDKIISRSNSKTSISRSQPMQDKILSRVNCQSEISTSELMQDKLISRSNSKTGICRSEPLKVMESSISKSCFATSIAISNQLKTISKCQSARSSSASSVVCKKRSASTISLRGTVCTKTKNETNLRKMISIAGDFKKNDITEKNIRHVQNEKTQNEETDSIKTAESVDQFKCKIKTFMDQWFSSLKNELKDTNNANNACDIEQLQILKSNDVLAFIDDWCASARESGVKKFMKEIEEGNKSLKNSEKQYNDVVIQHEKELLKLEKDLAEKMEADIVKKDEQIKEFQRKSKIQEKLINNLKMSMQNWEKEKEQIQTDKNHLKEELKTCKDCIGMTNKKLHDSEQQSKQDKKELKAKNEIIKKLENDLANKNKLEIELDEMFKKLDDLETKLKQKASKECVEHMKQISELTNRVSCLESDRQALQQRNEKLEQEINDFEQVSEKLVETENKLRDLQTELDNKEKSRVNVPDNSKEVQMELAKLRQSEAEKRREIDKLKTELSKTQFNICQLEQQVQRDQQLLEVRSGLINSLQSNEKTHRTHIEELFAQVGEKNTTINELNSELQSKSEEFRNLFTTLSAKQMEVANQEHIIKLLEESNERSQMLRVKQEEKIGRLEEGLAHLKHTIAMYHQANILAGNSVSNLLHPPILPSEHGDCNENFYYYVSQRKRKRHVDINVKKYEA